MLTIGGKILEQEGSCVSGALVDKAEGTLATQIELIPMAAGQASRGQEFVNHFETVLDKFEIGDEKEEEDVGDTSTSTKRDVSVSSQTQYAVHGKGDIGVETVCVHDKSVLP